MSVIENQITVGETDIVEVGSDPGAGVGTPAPVGTLGILQDEGAQEGSLYQKFGPLDTDWVQIKPSNYGGGVSGIRVHFWNDGATENIWAQRENNHTERSGPVLTDPNVEPYTFIYDGSITSLSFINKKEYADTDAEIYKNGILVYTWEIRLMKWAVKTNIVPVEFSAGDHLSVYFRKVDGGNRPEKAIIDIYASFTSAPVQEIGSGTL